MMAGAASNEYSKAAPTVLGEKFGNWAGRPDYLSHLPGNGLVQFDLNRLTLEDYRTMLTHPQVAASMAVLSFMQHQSNWVIDCDDAKTKALVTEQLTDIWTQLNRSLSQANWAGYSPNVLQWENDLQGKKVVLTKIKDLRPEECMVHWDYVDGYIPPDRRAGAIPPKIPVFGGIDQYGWPYTIPVDNAFWYPILMENGDYYGRKLLKSAFTPYFFSMLVHLYSNRYYERFGEPVPVGRAPTDGSVMVNGRSVSANEYMMQQIMQLRNRSVVVLPSDRGEDEAGRGYFEYDLQYLESQMRGADFERYLQRLDEEISLAIFTPVLLMKTADVGSYNLGVGHMQIYLWMLNALNADRKQYIDKYIIAPMVRFNYNGKNVPKCTIRFNKLDNTNSQLVTVLLQALISEGKVKFDLEQLGEMAGLTITEVNELVPDPTPPDQNPDVVTQPDKTPASKQPKITKNSSVMSVRAQIFARVVEQVENAYLNRKYGPDFKLSMGFKKKLGEALGDQGAADRVYSAVDIWAADVAPLGTGYLTTPRDYASAFLSELDAQLANVVK